MTGAVDIPYKAMLSLVIGQKSQAREILAQLVEARPENIMAHLCLAIASPRQEAVEILQKILEIDPTNPIALRNLKRLQQDPKFELDLETFWTKENEIINKQPKPLLPESDSRPKTRRILVAASSLSGPPQQVFVPEIPDNTAAIEPELAEFGQELATMQIEAGLAEFGEQTPTMPVAFMRLVQMVKTIEEAIAPPSSETPLINRQQEEVLASWLGLRAPDPATTVGTALSLSELTALIKLEVADLPPIPVITELTETNNPGLNSPLRPEQVVGNEAEILERYRPQVEPLRQTAQPGSADNSFFSLFTVVSLLIALILIGLVIYGVLLANPHF